MKSKNLLLGILASLLLSICAFAQVQITALSGTVYDQNGVGKVGAKLYVVKTIKDGALVSGVQAVATSTTGGAITLNVVRGSTVYLYSTDIPYFSSRGPAGMPFAIQDVSSASLESLTLITSVMQAQGDTAAAGANGRPARVAGNTTTTPKYYRQVGSSGIAGVPTWGVPLLTELGDVQIGTPTNGQVLKYDSTLGKWTAQADATGGGGGSISVTPNRALASDGSGAAVASAVTDTELGRLSGVTSGIQAQLNAKAATSHTHAESEVTNLVSDLALKAALASPAFTGTPTAPTATGGTNTTQIATTAFVQAAIAGGTAGVASFNGRTGIVVPATNDYTWAQVDKTTSSLADLTTRSATDLTSGTLPLARLSNITNTEISASAAIALSKLASGSSIPTSVTNDTNITGSISTNILTLGFTGTLAAGRLNSNVVQAITNDTNIIGSISAQTLTLGFTGTLAKARQNGATVYNDAGNTYSTGAQDFGAATSLKVPTSAGAAPTANGLIAYDSTANAYKGGVSAASKTFLMTDGSGAALTSLNASNLASGTVPLARLSGITNTEISAAAAIGYSKLALSGAILNTDLAGSIADSKLSTITTAGKVNVSAITGTLTAANGGTGQTAVTNNGVLIADGSTFGLSVIPSCSNGTTDKLLYNNTTRAFSCGSDQTGAGGGGITTLNTLTGTTQTFSRTNDTNVTLTLTPSGTDHNFALGWTGTLAVSRGGIGVGTLTGIAKGNGTSAFTAAVAGTDYVAPGAATGAGLTMATNRILGRTTASTGAIEEITPASTFSFTAGGLDVATGGITNAMLAGSIADSKLSTISTAGKVADSALSSNVTLGGNTFSGTGSILRGTSPSGTNFTISQAANGNNALYGKRFTDTSPTGNLIQFQNAAASSDLFAVDVTGSLTAGIVPSARLSGALPALDGSSLTNLNASNLASGTVPLARLSGITNTEISGSAAIAYSKLNLTGAVLNADLAGSIANAKLANSAITIAGTSTSLGGSITIDTITGLSSTGLLKRTGANTLAIATPGTDYLTGNQTVTLSGDVTGSGATAITTALANIPSAVPMAGSLLATNITAPSTPATGKTSLYVDSTSKNFAAKNDAGTVNHGIQTRTATANNWIRSIADDGSTTISQPAFTDISGSVAASQMPAHTGDVTSSAGSVALSIANLAVTNAMLAGSIADTKLSTIATAGKVSDSALSSNVTLGGNTFSGTGSILRGTSPTATNFTISQAANGNTAIYGKRFTDTTPTGNLIQFQNAAASSDLFAVDVTGSLTAGIVPSARLSGALPALDGSSLTNLNASNLASGTVPLARLSGITNTEISGSAAIALSKLASGTSIPTSVSNDTNVTGSIASNVLTLGFTGTLAKARQNAATVYNDAGNTYSTGAQDFGSATSLKVPTGAGAAPTASALVAYDSTSNSLEYGENGTNRTVANLDGTQTFTGKTISGASNTLSNIANASLTNSSVTIGSTSVSLGSTAATVAGLTLTTPTIASFANATHNHTNAAGGGQLTDAALSAAVTTAKGGTGLTATPTNGQLPIGNGSGFTLAGITGTSNQVTVTPGAGSITLALPQSIATASTPQFAGIGVGGTAPAAGILLSEQSAPSTPAGDRAHLYAANGEGNVSNAFVKADNGIVSAIAQPGQYALKFDSTQQHHVFHGNFWPAAVNLSKVFFWEGWVKPDNLGGYIISEGYGGLHSLLFGTGGIGAGTYNLITGNVTDGTNALSFGSDDGAISGEWIHYAVGSDGNKIVTYVNGVPSGAVAYSQNQRQAQQGTLFVGGSGHSNYGGSIAQLRGFEGTNPMVGTFDAANRMLVSFRPETRFGGQAIQRSYNAPELYASFLADYTSPATVIPDRTPVGYNGGTHPGQLWATTTASDAGINSGFGKNVAPSRYPLPKFVPDLSAPYAAVDSVPSVPTSATLTPPATPGSALIFDSFSRADSTLAFDNATPTLGSTEAGLLGALAWDNSTPTNTLTITATGGTFTITYAGQTTSAQAFNVSAASLQTAIAALSSVGAGKVYVTSPSAGTYRILFSALLGQQSSNFSVGTGSLTGGGASLIAGADGIGDWSTRWGILKGRAVALGGPAYQVAFVNAGQSNMDVSVERRYNGSYGDGRTSLAFRVVDGLNFWFIASEGTSLTGQTIRWGYYANGGRNDVGSASAPASAWQALRVTVSTGNQITVYCDGTQITQFTNSQFSTGTRAGLFMDDFGTGFSGLARFDNFTVKSF